jgi:hypothetical protein
MQVIQTPHKGILFRSRLEARWAVFFDHLEIEWEYELEGYDLDGVKYLPDFYLPKFDAGVFVECKPIELNKREKLKADLLVLHTEKKLLKAIGTPKNKPYEFIYFDRCDGVPGLDFYHAYLSKYHNLDSYQAAVNAALSERFENGPK